MQGMREKENQMEKNGKGKKSAPKGGTKKGGKADNLPKR